MTVFYLCALVTAIVFIIMIFSLIKLRFANGSQVPHFHKNFIVEMIWTLIPFIIVIGLSIPAAMVIKHRHELSALSSTKEFHIQHN